DRAIRIEHAKVKHGVDFYRDVVARDHALRRYVHRHGAEIDAHQLLDDRNDVGHARPARLDHAAEAEDDRPLVFAEDLDAADEQDDDDDNDRRRAPEA